jgi:dihydroorotate dehydrogenase (fumarate)
MIRPISTFSTVFYAKLAKPVLFLFPADVVHAVITKLGIIAENIPFVPALIKKMWRYDDKILQQNIEGIEFTNPIGLSAGFDKEVRLPKLMYAIGFGVAEVGSITAQPYNGNAKPWYSRLRNTKSILVNSGLRSSGVKKIANKADTIDTKVYDSIVINVSVARTNFQTPHTLEESIEDYLISLRRLEKSIWHKVYTINISCPNTAGGEPFNKPENLKKLLAAIDSLQLTRPVFLKLPIDLGWEKTKLLIDVASKSGVTGLTIGNLSKDRSLVHEKDTLTDDMKGNLSGKPCWDASNELLARTRNTYKNRFILVGVGGTFTGNDAYTKIRLGANFVELITGMIFNGPSIIGSINYDVAKLLRKDGLKNVNDAIGLDTTKYLKSLETKSIGENQ